ncbi:MAG: hypothetical protein QOF32_1170 [Gammaproteobacteria bacterium]|jgi:hypothetical protein|nr:hypothetical protein [Gammaproteobacteria bacterium]
MGEMDVDTILGLYCIRNILKPCAPEGGHVDDDITRSYPRRLNMRLV